jgi:predicted ATPase
MINKITLSGFKCFRSQEIEFGDLTVLAGLNNSGKSTIIQSIRMCVAACHEKSPYIDGYGGYSELRSGLVDANSPVELTIQNSNAEEFSLFLTPDGHKVVGSFVLPVTQYVSADRFGPRVSLPLLSDDVDEITVGHLGQYSAHYASIFENTMVAPLLRNQESASNTLKHQLVKWVSEISPGVRLDFDVLRKYDSSTLAVDGNRPTNSGFGISYTLPIILCLLTMTGNIGTDDSVSRVLQWYKILAEKGGLLLIENPEAHLHPQGQTRMGQLVAAAASLGLQIIVETHSDHFLDGIRLAVKNGYGPNFERVKIGFFSKQADGSSELTKVALREDGKLDHWPKGFFDQFSINLRELSKRNG